MTRFEAQKPAEITAAEEKAAETIAPIRDAAAEVLSRLAVKVESIEFAGRFDCTATTQHLRSRLGLSEEAPTPAILAVNASGIAEEGEAALIRARYLGQIRIIETGLASQLDKLAELLVNLEFDKAE